MRERYDPGGHPLLALGFLQELSMNKAERLFLLTNLLRSKRTVITARELAERLGVSERTIYRDIQSLELSGIPIEGEAGVGYRIRHNFELPPLMFDAEEILALLLGSRMVRAWADAGLAAGASRALAKIQSILPDSLKQIAEQQSLIVPNFSSEPEAAARALILRKAIERQLQVRIQYIRADGEFSERTLEPLGQIFWGGKWTLIAWCCLRDSYREFRLDRIQQLEPLEQYFTTDASKSLPHYLELVKAQYHNKQTQG
ncbi:helix-turn-helix transcriptional regulator [Oceanobacter antarcticus]|uniref:YafY family protein n=1 Tax=Oceanobacter antarcticus TaxID=3133425 RepID=A0ABW8NKV4_9GAMM